MRRISNLRSPVALKKGDKIAFVSTARKISAAEVSWAKSCMESWGFEIVLGQTIGLVDNQFAGTDEERAKDFQQMMDRKDIKAIVCARGGYGTVRILDQLDFTNFTNHPKWIVGYSDVTVLHCHINNYLGIQSLHASMPINFEDNSKESLASLQNALLGEKENYEFPIHPLNREGQVQGEIVGGNLSILYSILGTKSGFNTSNKILFIEDLDEYLYHIDRMMMALKRAGKLAGLKGLIVGGMTQMNDNAIPFGQTAVEIIKGQCATFNYPVCFGLPIGHLKDNRTLKLGANYKLDVNKDKVSLINI